MIKKGRMLYGVLPSLNSYLTQTAICKHHNRILSNTLNTHIMTTIKFYRKEINGYFKVMMVTNVNHNATSIIILEDAPEGIKLGHIYKDTRD